MRDWGGLAFGVAEAGVLFLQRGGFESNPAVRGVTELAAVPGLQGVAAAETLLLGEEVDLSSSVGGADL